MNDDDLLDFDEAEDFDAPVAQDLIIGHRERKGLAPPKADVDWGLNDKPAPRAAATVDWGMDDKPAGLIENPPLPRSRPQTEMATPSASAEAAAPPTIPGPPTPESSGGFSDYPIEFGKGVIEGAKNMGAAALKGVAGTQTPTMADPTLLDDLARSGDMSPDDRAKLQARALKTISDRGLQMDFGGALGRIAAGADPAQEVDALRSKFAANNASAATPVQQRPLYQAGQAIEEFGKDTLAPRPGFEPGKSWTRDLGTGAGSMAAGIGVSMIPGIGPAAAGTLFTTAGMGEATDKAVKEGATPDQTRRAALLGGAAGATDMVDTLLPMLGTPGRVLGFVKRMGLAAVKGAIMEGGQEGVQQLMQNAIAKGIYKPDQDLLEDVPRSMAIAAILGGAGGAISGAAHRAPPAKSSPEEIADFIRKAAEAGGAQQAEPSPEPSSAPGLPAPQQGSSPTAPPPEAAAPVYQAETVIDIDGMRTVLRNGRSVGPDVPEAPAAPQPSPDISPDEAAILRAYGYSDDQIQDMSPAQRAAEAEEARAAGTTVPEQVDWGMDDEIVQPAEPEEASFGTEDRAIGTRAAPVQAETADDIAAASGVVDTAPTEAQKAAGNYQKQHVKWNNLDLTIENPKGSTRTGTSPDGQPWSVQMPGHYGYVKRSRGADGDQVDVYLGDHLDPNGQVYVVDQNDPTTGKFDEHKVVMGVQSEAEARALYEQGFSDGSGASRIGAITAMSPDDFKGWLKNGDTTNPIVQTRTVKAPPKPKSSEPLSLLQFIASKGGLKPDPELSVMDLTGSHRVQVPGRRGFFGVVRPGGMSLDEMRELAEEAGYFRGTDTSTSSVRDFLDAVDGELRGQRRFAEGEEGAISKRDQERIDEENAHRKAIIEDNKAEIRQMLADYGMPPITHEEDLNLAAEIMADEGLSPDDALERAFIRNVHNMGDDAVTRDQIDDTYEFGAIDAVQPEPTPENVPTASQEGGGRERSREEGGPSEPGDDGARAGEDRGRPEQGEAQEVGSGDRQPTGQDGSVSGEAEEASPAEPAVEAPHSGRTADQVVTERTEAGEQAVLPGAEKVGDGDLAQRKADQSLKPKAPQKPADEGLFGDDSKQTDLLDQKPQPAAKKPKKAKKPSFVDRMENYFRPGRIVESYSGKDRVISFERLPGDQWQVEVVETKGGNDVGPHRRHGTAPDSRELARWEKDNPVGSFTDNGLHDEVQKTPQQQGRSADQTREDDGPSQEDGEKAQPAVPREKTDQTGTEARESGPSDSEATLAGLFAKRFLDGETFPTILAARRLAKETFGATDAKQVEEQIELGVVKAAREVVILNAPGEAFPALVNLYAAQPKLGTRTSTSMRDQAFSTPVPLAYLASRLAGVAVADVVFEPTAGNGALLIEATPEQTVVANEINPARADNLKSQGFNVTSQDAVKPTHAQAINAAYEGADVVIANPPFGAVKEDGTSTVYDLSDIQPGYKTTQIDHAIALRSLVALRDNGRAVLIVGGLNKLKTSKEARSDGYNGKDKREFYKALYDRYNVVDHFTVAGELYERQGAGWPVDVIVIEGRGKSARSLPAVDVPKVYSSWDQLGELLDGNRSDARTPRGQDGAVDKDDTAGRPRVPDERVHPLVRGSGIPDRVAPADDTADIRSGSFADKSGNDAADRAGDPDGVQPGARGDARRPDPAPAAERRPPRVEQETERQVAYKPRSSKTNSLGTLVPVNMRTSVQDSLARISERVGDIDSYVANELGYTPDELAGYFGAEQVDALALAIDNLQRGKGFIIGDQTGIGKGRVNAAIIRWAIKNGRIPVFVTEKPNLYGDMYRDLNDIGISDGFLDGPPRILATNAGANVPLTDDGSVVLRTPAPKVHNAELSALTTSNFTDKYDMVFTNYSQMQTLKGENTPRRGFLSNIIHNAVLIFDESHNAGGQDQSRKAKGEKADRAGFARDLVARANGVFYSSATYAKRPDVMDLYSATDMTLAVAKPSDLGEAIAKGGVPMQQVVATMLSQAGQYVRRERSFAGVTYDTPLIEVDREAYDGISRSLASILQFSDHVATVAERLDKELKGQASGTAFDNAVGDASAKSTSFTSVMHNIINQMLLAMKAKGASDRAIQAIRDGKKPVITLANTMESFLREFAEDTDIPSGGVIDASFGDVLRRYLDRTRTLLIKKPFAEKGDVQRKYLSDQELGGLGRRLYADTLAQINNLDLDNLPVSPIDAIKDSIRKAGYTVGEITGRGTIVDYSGDQPILKPRPGSETSIRGRRQTIADFNSGKLDAVILNQAGATGLSLHASEKFKDQRQRKMIIAQAEANIDTHMQMLGRVHRTGQVVTPEYEQLVADIPAEKRPAAVLAKKMASLNANTTASRGGALTAKDVPDFINEYGDVVAGMYIAEHPEMNARLGEPIKFKDNGGLDASDAMRKLTGRVPLLPLKQQEELYDLLEGEYDAFLKQMEASGENALEAKTYDLKAKTLESVETVAAKAGGGSPFAAPVVVERVSTVRLGKPFPSHEVVQRVFDTIDARDSLAPSEITKENAAQRYAALLKTGTFVNPSVALEPYKVALAEFDEYKRRILDDIATPDRQERERVNLDAIRDRWKEIVSTLPIGQRVTFKTATGNLTGIVTRIEQKGQPKNPLALSSWKVTAAIADASRQVTIPVSRLWPDGKSDSEDPFAVEVSPVQDWLEKPEQTLERFDTMQSDAREERFIATGNLLAAYDWLNKRGRIINYTDDSGNIRQGILTPSDFDLDSYIASRPSIMHNARDVVDYLEAHKGTSLWSQDQVVRVAISKAGKLLVTTDAAKKTGGKFYLDRQLTDLTGDFIKTGGSMKAETWSGFEPVIRRLQELGAVFEGRKEPAPSAASGTRFSIRPGSRSIESAAQSGRTVLELQVPSVIDPAGRRTDYTRIDQPGQGTPTLTPAMRERVEHALTGIVRKVAGPSIQVRFVDIHRLKAPPQGWGEFRPDAATAAGSYVPARALITVALNDPSYPLAQALDTTFHEAFHAVEDRLLTDQEMAILKREDGRLRDVVKRAFGFSDAQIKSIAGFEIRAMAFEIYASDRARGTSTIGMHIGIRRAFERLLQMFRRIRNYLNGLGFRNADDILRQVYDGEVADRAAGRLAGDEQFNVRPRQEQVRPRGNLNTFESFDPLPENWRDWWKRPDLKWSDRVWGMIDTALLTPNRSIGDRYVDMRRMQAAVEMTGKQINDGVDMALAATLFEGRTEKRLKDYWLKAWKPALDAVAESGLTREELHQYLYARHAPERNARIADINLEMTEGGSGMTDDEAREIMERFASEGKREKLERAAQMIDTIVRRIRATMVADQLEHEETIAAWEQAYQYYVPLRGFESGDESIATAVPPRSSGFDVRGSETKAALGRQSKADDILSNLFLMGERAIIRGEQNRVGRTAMRFMQSNPHPDLYTVHRSERVLTKGRTETATEEDLDLLRGDRPVTTQRLNRDSGLVETVTKTASPFATDSFAVKVGGHTYYIQIKHEGLLTALKNVGIQRVPWVIQKVGFLTRQFSALRTARSPEFFVTNLLRDLQDASYTITAEEREGLLRHYSKNVLSLRTYIAAVVGEMTEGGGRIGAMARRKFANSPKVRLFEDWKKNGGQIAFMGLHDIEDVRKEIGAAFDAVNEGTGKKTLMAVPRGARNFIKAIEFFNAAIEGGTRLAVYDAALKAGMTKAKAAQLSKEATTNFNRKGIYTPYLNSIFPFFNARVQGGIKIIRLLRQGRHGAAASRTLLGAMSMARRAAIGIAMAGFSATMWNLAMSGDDDDGENRYAQRKYWEREKNYLFYLPGVETPLKYAQGYGVQLFWMLGENMAMVLQGKSSPSEAAANYLGTLTGAFSPVTAEGSLTDPRTWLRMITPGIFSPLGELGTNQNWLGRPIHPEYGSVGEPASQRYFTSTSPLAIDVAQFLNRISGGDAFKPGYVDLYPGTVENLWNFIAGGLGQTGARTATMLRNWADGIETPSNQIPFVRSFVPADNKYGKAEKYYSDQREVQEGMARVRRALKDEDPRRADDARKTVEEGYDTFNVRPGKRKGTIRSDAESIFRDAQKELKDLRAQEAQVRADPTIDRKSKNQLIEDIRENMRQVQAEARKAYRQIKAPSTKLDELRGFEREAVQRGDRGAAIIIRSQIRNLESHPN